MSTNSIITIALAYGALAASLEAVGIIGVGSDGNFYKFNSTNLGSVAQLGSSGAAAGFVDIDVHAANAILYGIAGSGATSRISDVNGNVAFAYSPNTPYASAVTSFDHNPAADRVRIVAGNNNYRVVPDFATAPQNLGMGTGTVTTDGVFTFFDSVGAARSGVTILGAGYTNPVDNPQGNPPTTLYTISSDGFLNIHSSPAGSTPAGNFGRADAVGSTGLSFVPVNAGFDIGQDGIGYASVGNVLHTINLADGTSASLGTINLPGGVTLTSLAVIPEPSTVLLGSIAGLALMRRRRVV